MAAKFSVSQLLMDAAPLIVDAIKRMPTKTKVKVIAGTATALGLAGITAATLSGDDEAAVNARKAASAQIDASLQNADETTQINAIIAGLAELDPAEREAVSASIVQRADADKREAVAELLAAAELRAGRFAHTGDGEAKEEPVAGYLRMKALTKLIRRAASSLGVMPRQLSDIRAALLMDEDSFIAALSVIEMEGQI